MDNLIKKHGGPSHIEAEFEEKLISHDSLKQYIDSENVQFEEMKIRFETSKPLESLAKLNRSGVRFSSLKVQTANLEDVFLNLTGRRLRD